MGIWCHIYMTGQVIKSSRRLFTSASNFEHIMKRDLYCFDSDILTIEWIELFMDNFIWNNLNWLNWWTLENLCFWIKSWLWMPFAPLRIDFFVILRMLSFTQNFNSSHVELKFWRSLGWFWSYDRFESQSVWRF